MCCSWAFVKRTPMGFMLNEHGNRVNKWIGLNCNED